MRQFSAMAASVANSTALRFNTGKAPGKPRQTGQTLVLGAIPKAGRAGAEDFGRGKKLDVHFQPDYRLVLGTGGYGDVWRGGHIRRL